jgi:MFS superfamily sulfate permease-like transporter
MKLFIRAQVIGFSVVGFTIAVALLIFNNQFFDFLGITVSENYALNQIKADLGGLWILVGVAPLLWLRTQDNFWIRILFAVF